MAKEIELKLAIPPQAGNTLRHHKVLEQAVSFDSKALQNIYFDTPDLALNKARVALRVRKAGERYIQTLKTSGSGSGGLHERGEWEWDVKGPALELDRITPELLPDSLDAEQLKNQLQPVFETNFQRDRWLLDVRFQGLQAEIELVLDKGMVLAETLQDPISEIELELKSGDADLLFKIAHDLSDTVPLVISNISKAQRGFRLFSPQHAGTGTSAISPFENSKGLIRAAQTELDNIISQRDQLAFNRDWSLLPGMYDNLRQLRWCLLHLSRLSVPPALHFPVALRYKLRMFSYSLEHLANLQLQKQAWERLDSCPPALRNSADFVQLNESFQTLFSAPWVGQTLLEVMQWLYLMYREADDQTLDTDAMQQQLLAGIRLPRYPTDKVLWLRLQGPLLHLSRWIHYQHPQPALGLKKLLQEADQLLRGIAHLSGLMAEELSVRQHLSQQSPEVHQDLLQKNQDDQYEQVLQLGRHELSFNSLQQNLLQ